MKHEHVILQFGKTLGKNGSSRALNSPLDSTMGGRGAFNLFGHIWTRHHLSLWYHPVLMHCTSHSGWLPPGEPESHHREREDVSLERKKAKVGKAPSPAAVHSQVLRQGVKADSVQQEQADISSSCGWHGLAGASSWWAWSVSLLPEIHPELPAGCPTSPRRGARAQPARAALSSATRQHGATALPAGIPPGAHPETTLPFLLLPQQSPVPLPASCTSTQVRGRIPEVLSMPQENLWALPGAACWAGLTQCPDQYLDTAACFCLAANIPCVTFSSQLM